MQMTAIGVSITGAPSTKAKEWNGINWDYVYAVVKRLQMRIAKAIKEGRYNKAKALQWILTHSYYAKLLAIKRVTQNTGAKTPGVDGVKWKTSTQKMQAVLSLKRRGYQPQPLRRIYIPKKLGGKRPLSIPCMIDRGMQALHLMALEPVMETMADKNSYGFRPKRSCADAIEQCFTALARKAAAQWVIEGDIKACFDKISGQWLLNNILTDKVILAKWLTAGYMEQMKLHSTFDGVPQGGIISPALLVLTLAGLEKRIKKATNRKDKVNTVLYADDLIITGNSKEMLEYKVLPVVEDFLKERRLELSIEKTKLTHIDDGFEFLGFTIRKCNGKLLIKPSKKNIKSFLASMRKNIKTNATVKTDQLIRLLNPKIRGWTNYFRHVVAKATFSYIDYHIFRALLQWVKRRHPNKGAFDRNKIYFSTKGSAIWIFSVHVKNKKGKCISLELLRASQTPIHRHIKIKAEANPYDPAFNEYFLKRKLFRNKARKIKEVSSSIQKPFQEEPTDSRIM